jgi:acyl-CoA synthetase (AMP-forming)/AMP-acid ligase II
VTLGYLNNEQATNEAYFWDDDGRWIRTGDEVIVTKGPSGYEHLVIVDRLKELIKVKVRYSRTRQRTGPDTKHLSLQGHQVAPAELEAHLLTHALVDDVAVISVPDERAGEVPKAFVVKAQGDAGKSDDDVRAALFKHVEEHKAKYKWLKGGIEFIDVVPKSPSGKILRRLLRDKEKEARRKAGGKL